MSALGLLWFAGRWLGAVDSERRSSTDRQRQLHEHGKPIEINRYRNGAT